MKMKGLLSSRWHFTIALLLGADVKQLKLKPD